MSSNQNGDITRSGSAAQDDDMGCTITIVNHTGHALVLNASPEPSSGGYTDSPPERIGDKKSVVVKARGTAGTSTGVTFHFVYQLGDDPNTTFTWKCDIPYDGADTFNVTATGPQAANYEVDPSSYNPGHADYLIYTTTIKSAR